jgi:hypothetical protein
MTFIPVNFDDAVEAQPAAAGRYALQILKSEVTVSGEKSKNPGSPQFRVTIGFETEDNVPNITQYISLPAENDEPKSAQYKVLLLKRFLEAFNIPYDQNGIDTERMAMDMVGSRATCEVTVSEPDDNGNVYNRIQVPRLRTEAGRSARGR